jgi:Ser/Thr protein kinase RdoA (MazF antagonist)
MHQGRARPGLGRVKHPYQALTPDVVLDALSVLGLPVDGRMSVLSSYENRVYQVMLDDAAPVVVKIYRPGRWSDAQILEEHAFTEEMLSDDIPVVGPMRLQGRTLHEAQAPGENGAQRFVFSVSPRRGGRWPELDDPEVRHWIGRFLARIHNVGARSAFQTRPTLNVETFGWESLHWLQDHQAIALEVEARWLSVGREALTVAQAALAPAWGCPSRQHSVDPDGRA